MVSQVSPYMAPYMAPFVGYLWAICGFPSGFPSSSICRFPKWLHMQSPKMAFQVAFQVAPYVVW